MQTGKFITIEGAEGVGKSTNIQHIQNWLSARHIPFILTREPGGTELGEQLRELLLHGGQIADKTELLLMFAARAQHLEEKIKPALAAGTWVICDRFTDSTFAYQGGGRQLNLQWLNALENLVQETLQPDITFLLDAPVEVGMARAKSRNGRSDRIEAESMAFFERVRAGFLQRAALHPARFRIINAAEPLPLVQAEIDNVLVGLCPTV
ncbi:MAG: dTMP kinase [Oceanospirillaceae bacterium]|nr:dTMP kinase [Oceanospirillaceae bacterium]MCP5349414.1 dTMP kinase [Oceanospirillaceae bacterium]